MSRELDVNFFDQEDKDVDCLGHKIPPRVGETVIDMDGKYYRVMDVIWFSEWGIGNGAHPKCSVILKKVRK